MQTETRKIGLVPVTCGDLIPHKRRRGDVAGPHSLGNCRDFAVELAEDGLVIVVVERIAESLLGTDRCRCIVAFFRCRFGLVAGVSLAAFDAVFFGLRLTGVVTFDGNLDALDVILGGRIARRLILVRVVLGTGRGLHRSPWRAWFLGFRRGEGRLGNSMRFIFSCVLGCGRLRSGVLMQIGRRRADLLARGGGAGLFSGFAESKMERAEE